MWMFSRLFDSSDVVTCEKTRESLFRDASIGALFLINCVRPKDGNYYFSVSRDGKKGLHVQRKPYTGVFLCYAFLEFDRILRKHAETLLVKSFMKKNGSNNNFLKEARDAFSFVAKCLDDPSVCGAIASDTPPSILGEVMCLSGMSEEFLNVLPEERDHWMRYIESAMRRVIPHFDTTKNVFMETAIDPNLGVDHSTSAGRLLNPGHSIEVSWFLIHLTRHRKSEKHLKIALDALEGALQLGWNSKNGGITYMKDVLSKPLLDTTVVAEHVLWWVCLSHIYIARCIHTHTHTHRSLFVKRYTRVHSQLTQQMIRNGFNGSARYINTFTSIYVM